MRLYDTITLEKQEFPKDEVATALKHGFVPSVTTILDIINPGEHILKWNIENAIKHFQENNDIKEAVKFRDNTSSDFGTVCHNLIESYLNCKEYDGEYEEIHLMVVEPMYRWIDEYVDQPLFTERNFADGGLKYGGTADMLLLLNNGEKLLGDLKVKKHSYKFPMKPSIGYKYQLSAYRNHFRPQYGEMQSANFLLASPFGYGKNAHVYVNKKPELKVFHYGYDDWTEGFQAAHKLWYDVHLHS